MNPLIGHYPKDKDGMPKEWPILGPDDIYKQSAADSEQHPTKCCLLGWVNTVVCSHPYSIGTSWFTDKQCQVVERIKNEIKKTISNQTPWKVHDIVYFNDSRWVSKKQIAAVWNLTGQNLGYDIPDKYCRIKL